MVEEKRNNLEGRFERASLSLEFSSGRECYLFSEAVEKGLPAPNLTACSVSCYSKSHWIGLTGPADHSMLGSIQNVPNTRAKHYKEPC